MAVEKGNKDRAAAIEEVRKSLVSAAVAGRVLALDCGSQNINWKTDYCSDAANFPTETIFNFAQWREKENYIKIVRDSENRNTMGNPGCYGMNEKFSIVLIS